MLKPIAKLIAALNGNLKKSQIALGFAWGALLGLIPANTVFWVVLFVLSFFLRHNHAGKVLMLALLKLLGVLLDPALDALGWAILTAGPLQGFFTMLYNLPLFPLSRFNNTLVMGGIAAGVIAFIVVFALVLFLVPLYRNTIAPKIRHNKFIISLKAVPVFSRLASAVNDAMQEEGLGGLN
jgi:uncharacterized protein (TIGR03546 family)